MTVTLNFNLGAWVKELKIEAHSEKDAIEKLMGMTVAEIIEEGAVIDSGLKIDDIETTVTSYDLKVQVSEVEYDLDPEIMDVAVIEYLKNFLPKDYTITLKDVTDSDNIEELIKDELFYETNYNTKSFKFQILEKI